jgi:(E)-4-hydroxy-3-methylbut-2-enyl-diphosphate synthase
MVGNVAVGGGAPISIQSMATTPTTDVARTVDEIKRMEDAGVDIARVSVPDIERSCHREDRAPDSRTAGG